MAQDIPAGVLFSAVLAFAASSLQDALSVPREHAGRQFLDRVGGFCERPYSQNPFNDILAVTCEWRQVRLGPGGSEKESLPRAREAQLS